MYNLTNTEKLDFIIETCKKTGITAYEFGQNTTISELGARNILEGKSKNPRAKNLNIMLKYLMDINTATEAVKEIELNGADKTQLIKQNEALLVKVNNTINQIEKEVKEINGYKELKELLELKTDIQLELKKLFIKQI